MFPSEEQKGYALWQKNSPVKGKILISVASGDTITSNLEHKCVCMAVVDPDRLDIP